MSMNFRDVLKAQLSEYMEDLQGALDGLTPEERRFQPTPESHHIDFTVWHMARVEDGLVNRRIRRGEQIWERDGWSRRLGLPERDSGFGFTAEQVSDLPVFSLDELMEYYQSVRGEVLEFVDSLSAEDLDAPLYAGSDSSVGGVLSHLVVEEAQHVGQVAYIRGMQRGING